MHYHRQVQLIISAPVLHDQIKVSALLVLVPIQDLHLLLLGVLHNLNYTLKYVAMNYN
jgi:hypothetical protein